MLAYNSEAVNTYTNVRIMTHQFFLYSLFNKFFFEDREDIVNYYCDILEKDNQEYENFFELVNPTIGQSDENHIDL